jgi:hypothetical protein
MPCGAFWGFAKKNPAGAVPGPPPPPPPTHTHPTTPTSPPLPLPSTIPPAPCDSPHPPSPFPANPCPRPPPLPSCRAFLHGQGPTTASQGATPCRRALLPSTAAARAQWHGGVRFCGGPPCQPGRNSTASYASTERPHASAGATARRRALLPSAYFFQKEAGFVPSFS